MEVLSPSLVVCFHKKRFTEPVWLDGMRHPDATVVRVKVADKNHAKQLRANLAEWTESPSSLLFFRSLRELTIDGATVRKRVTKIGPVPNSRYLTSLAKILSDCCLYIPLPKSFRRKPSKNCELNVMSRSSTSRLAKLRWSSVSVSRNGSTSSFRPARSCHCRSRSMRHSSRTQPG